MAMPVGHAAAEERHRRIEQWLAAEVLGLGEAGQEVTELLDGEGVVVRERLDVAGVASVVAQLVARFSDADLRDGEGGAFTAEAEGGHAGGVRLEGQHHEVVDCAEIVAGLGGLDVTVSPLAVCFGDLRQGGVEPDIGATGADLGFADGGEVLVHAALVLGAHLLFESADFREVGVEHAAFMAEFAALGGLTVLRLFEQGGEDFAATAHRGEADAVGGPGEGFLVEGDLHRARPGVLGGELGHLLVDGDRIAVRGAEFAAGQPGVDALVVVAEAAGVIQAADRGDRLPMLLKRFEGTGELVVRPVLGDLVVERVDAVGQVDEGAALGRGGHLLGGA